MNSVELLKWVTGIILGISLILTYELIRAKNGILRLLMIAFFLTEVWMHFRIFFFMLNDSELMRIITARALNESLVPKSIAYVAIWIFLVNMNIRSRKKQTK